MTEPPAAPQRPEWLWRDNHLIGGYPMPMKELRTYIERLEQQHDTDERQIIKLTHQLAEAERALEAREPPDTSWRD
jgi:hypothetical protein